MKPLPVEWVEQTCKELVDDPKAVQIGFKSYENRRLVITISAPEDEMGRIIGRYGDTIRSIRTIAYCLGMKGPKQKTSVLVDGKEDLPGMEG